jgi:protein involved in polysaccharide export with SLBB domain
VCPDDPTYVPSVLVTGKVSKAGKFALPDHEDLTVSGLFRLTGLPASVSSVPKVQIIRKTPQGNKRILVNTKAALVHKRSEYDLFLRPEDVVIVE